MGKNEGEGTIDLIIENIDKNFGGDQGGLQGPWSREYRASTKKKLRTK